MQTRSHPSHLASIEVCRGIAATMVLACHSANVLGAPANFGAAPFGLFFQFGRSGVDFFFVLSGFLISLLHWQDIGRPDRLRRYAIRRLTRIYPTYWLVLLAVIPYDLFTHTLFDDYGRISEVIMGFLLIPQQHRILDVTWSLCNELFFYGFFALLIFNRRLGFTVAALGIAALFTRPFIGNATENTWINLITYPMNFEFLAGVAAGWAFPRLKIGRPGILLTIGLALFAALWFAEDHLWFIGMSWGLFFLRCLGYAAAAVSVIVGLSAMELQGRIRMPRPLVMLGGASYLLYLVHVPALLLLGASERHLHLLRFAPPWLLASVIIALTVAGTVFIHRTIEKPMLNAIRNKPAILAGARSATV